MAQAGTLDRSETKTTLNQLDQLKRFTKVVADTAIWDVARIRAQDATTNPSLILKAAQMPEYKHLVEKAVADVKKMNVGREAAAGKIVDHLLILFGLEILKIIPGRVSTETDAMLSFDANALVNKAHQFISMYEQNGIGRERILIKIASTWEGFALPKCCKRKGSLQHDAALLAGPGDRLRRSQCDAHFTFRGAHP
jgi:transaldolase